MRISEGMVSSGGLDAVRKSTGPQKADKTLAAGKAKDSAVFSSKSQALSSDAEAQSVKSRAVATPDIREDRISEVRSKIESGFYDSEEFQDQLADRLINQMSE